MSNTGRSLHSLSLLHTPSLMRRITTGQPGNFLVAASPAISWIYLSILWMLLNSHHNTDNVDLVVLILSNQDQLHNWYLPSLKRPRHQTKIVSGAHPGAGARIAYTRTMSEHRCFPKKRLSTHAMHFRRVTGGISVSVTQPSTPASMEHRVAIRCFSIF